MECGIEELTKDWRWLFDPAGFELVAISPFGDLLMRGASGAYCVLDVNFGEVIAARGQSSDRASLFPENFDGRLAERYRAAGIELGDGQCYAFTTPVIAKEGSYEPGNVYAVSVRERVSFMGDFHRQIRDLPDGTRVRLVVR